jgi:putative endonuclease
MDDGRRVRGDEAEGLAARWLAERGYQIRERNFSCPYGELDLVAERDGVLCVIEVRMRSTIAFGDPAFTVGGVKQRRVIRATRQYLFERGIRGKQVRFDVITVVGSGEGARLGHLPDAFDAGM